ncbi:acetolactate synthase large subunit [Gordonia sp. CPCC 205515]|uniref:acetolactate synthase large subunit n=1 Tax=Gordonia sp. CPCC 205515 TaxID=3140791 RepID=UPI003AF39C4B
MNGSVSLIESLVAADVDVCFMNPGTSEMHFVHALDAVPTMRGVLGLFEGVVTGAADGYARISGKPAAVLLHLGPGLGNGLANLHNARRARSPMLVVVGAHATGHVRYDAPLESDIEALSRTVSGWVHTSGTAREVATDAMHGLAATEFEGGQIATLVLPADVSWAEGGIVAHRRPWRGPSRVPDEVVDAAAAFVGAGTSTVLFLGGPAAGERGLLAASRIAAATGARLLLETFPARLEAGAGLPAVDGLAYMAEAAQQQLVGTETLILAGAKSPVSFFAYPDKASDLVPEGCAVQPFAGPGDDVVDALERLAETVAADTQPRLADLDVPTDVPSEPLDVNNFAGAIAATLPEHAIIVDESNTSGIALPRVLATAPRHSQLTLTGGAIGQGLPTAVGAAIAAPDRPVLSLEADGSAMYTIQALWTQVRENLNVTTVILNNSAYAILRIELLRTGAGAANDRSAPMLSLADPSLDFVAMASGMGMPATRVTTADGLAEALRNAYAEPGPHLIDAIIPPIV